MSLVDIVGPTIGWVMSCLQEIVQSGYDLVTHLTHGTAKLHDIV